MLEKIEKALSDETVSYNSAIDLFASVGINQEVFQGAYRCLAKKTNVVMKRQTSEVWVNQYSKNLLKCWKANMDIQYVVDTYACVVYIISYISKPEREMGMLLGNAQGEASKGGNVSANEALTSLGSVYMHNRDVCAQGGIPHSRFYHITG